MPINTQVPPPVGVIEDGPFRANWAAIQAKIGTLPESYDLLDPGELIVIRDSADGITTASEGEAAITGMDRRMGHVSPLDLDISASTVLTTRNHNGCLLRMLNTNAVVLQVERTGDPTSGVQHGFSVAIQRPPGSGTVTISSTTLNNVSAQGFNRVSAGTIITLYVDARLNQLYLIGAIEA
jgi:hypothetical protein